MSGKAPDAFRTIAEVADELDLPQHVLRFWETKFSQIRPMKSTGGRRFYRTDDIALVRTIRDLLYGKGYTIRGVQQLLKEHGARGLGAHVPDISSVNAADANPAPRLVGTMVASDEPNSQPLEPQFTLDDGAFAVLRNVQGDLADCVRILSDAKRA